MFELILVEGLTCDIDLLLCRNELGATSEEI